MPYLLHLFGFCAYAALAAAIALHGPRIFAPWFPTLGQFEAYGLAALIFLASALVHEGLARFLQVRRHRETEFLLAEDAKVQREEMDWMRREISGLREAMAAAGASGNLRAGGRTIDEIMSEVKVLKTLMAQLSPAAMAAMNMGSVAASSAPTGAGAVAVATKDVTPKVKPRGAKKTAADGSKFGSKLPAAVLVHDAASTAPGSLPPVSKVLSDDQVLEVVRASLRNDQIDLVLQPIVSLPQRKRRFYECFSRLRAEDGSMVLPEQYISIAEQANLITAIDNMLLFRCVQLIRKIQRKSQNLDFFCNISSHTLADRDFFSDFLDFLDNNQELAGHLIFEFAQADFERWAEAGAGLLSRLSMLGCRISLDQVSDVDLDPRVLAARQVSFVKVEVGLLIKTLSKRRGLLDDLRRHQIDLIVEKVEDEARLIDLLDHEVDFGQGYLFGEPRLARPAA